MNKNSTLLLNALKANASFSGVSALLMFLFADWIASQLGLAGTLSIYVVAGFLVLFSIQLFSIVKSRKIKQAEILGIIGGDLAWVIASIVLVTIYYSNLTISGLVVVDVVALAVLAFAIAQIRGLNRYRASTDNNIRTHMSPE